jgi:hypothetical protein
MTNALPFTKASLRRRVEAAREVGLTVTEIRPDGTLVVRDSGDNEPADVAAPQSDDAKWASAKQ